MSKNWIIKRQLLLRTILCFLVTIFVFLLFYFLLPFSPTIKRKLFPLVAVLGFIFFILGVILVVMAKKEKNELKFFLIITGVSAISPFLCVILHNFFYALMIISEDWQYYTLASLSIASFFISLIIAPATFVVGIIGVLIFQKNFSKKL